MQKEKLWWQSLTLYPKNIYLNVKWAIEKAQMILYYQFQEQSKTCSNLGQKRARKTSSKE
jgi:hypothetical protein